MSNHTSVKQSNSWTGAKSNDVWERSGLLWSIFFFVGIVLGMLFAVKEGDLPADKLLWAAALNILLGGWHLGSLYLMRRIGHYRDRRLFGVTYVAGLIGLWFALVRIDPAFYVTQMSLWSQLFIALPIAWAALFAVFVFALNMYQQTFGVGIAPDWPSAILWLGFTGTAILFGYWIHTIIVQSSERKNLIQQLERTRAELAESERAAGISAERQRLAHEIHDTLAQGFISIIMQLEAAEQAMLDGSPTLEGHLGQARQTARESLEQARRVVNDLRPEILESAPFDDAVRRVVADWSAQNGVAAVFTRTGDIYPLHPGVEVTLLRAAQEALANVRKHAQAANVQATLSYLGDVVILDVQDDGAGFVMQEADHKRDDSGGFGLVAMRERVEQLGGELLIESEPGGGTTVAVSIPVGSSE